MEEQINTQDSDKTLIILDTNFLKEGSQNKKIYSILSSRSDFKEFNDFLEKNDLRDKIVFGIPQITFEEHFFYKNNDFNLDLENLKEKISQFNQMELLEGGKLDLKFKDSFNYRYFLNSLLESQENFSLLKMPEEKKKAIFESIVYKSINQKKPFHKKGDRNFKDALIWECICCQDFRDYSVVIFLTQNEDDFPKNSEIEEINFASRKTGKLIRILYKYDDLKEELEKIYKFEDKKLRDYLLNNSKEFEEKIVNWIIEEDGIPFKSFKLTKPCEKIGNVTNEDLKIIGFISQEGLKTKTDLEDLRFILVEFDGDLVKKEKYFGEVLYDLNAKEILHVRWDEA